MTQRKLIEVALPLDAINAACKADKDRSVGHIRNLHKWFAPMPLPAWRALLFATLVDDPDNEQERDQLMHLIERLVENGSEPPTPEAVAQARQAIRASWPSGVPTVADPFCGGGSTLVEAQLLGCAAAGSDLNPVPVLITKVLCELLPRVADRPALHPNDDQLIATSGTYDRLAQDVAHYAGVVRARARDRLKDAYADGEAVIAWLWCRTVNCPNPACRVQAPLLSSRWLSRQTGDEHHLRIGFDGGSLRANFSVQAGSPDDASGTVTRSGAECEHCGSAIPFAHIRSEGQLGNLGLRMTAIATQASDRRVYSPGTAKSEDFALVETDPEVADVALVGKATQNLALYGIRRQRDLYMPRQLACLTTFADEVSRISADVLSDGGDEAYAAAIASVLGLCVGRLAQLSSSLVRWNARVGGPPKAEPAFGRHDLPMAWDFAETNPFGGSRGGWDMVVRSSLGALNALPEAQPAAVSQRDARNAAEARSNRPTIWATDPPYFDQIAYADLSDYFYVWLRRALRNVHPDLLATLATPKEGELTALPGRHGGDKNAARNSFVAGFGDVFSGLAETQTPEAPFLVVYAFKEQAGSADGSTRVAPGWEAILDALIGAGVAVVGTWPIRGTVGKRMIGLGSNAVATYVVLVCRPRADGSPRITRSDLTRLLRSDLAAAVAEMQHASIAPVDLAQAVIGPGMAIYSKHSSVVETDGSRVGVAAALALINRTLAELLDEQEGDLDPDSRWAVAWYEQNGFTSSSFGQADQLARPKGVSVELLVRAGIVTSGGNKVCLIPRDQLPEGWDPATDQRATHWEAVQYLVRALDEGAESGAAELYARLGALADPTRELAYRLFRIAEKNGWTEEAIAYNSLVVSWSEIVRLAAGRATTPSEPGSGMLF